MKEIYLDNAAATPPTAGVVRAQARAVFAYGNPSSFNDAGRRAAKVLAGARARIARFLNARPDEIIFCASGSEANTLALVGNGHSVTVRTPHIISSPTEHPSVLGSVARLRRRGWRVSWASVDAQGRVSADEISRTLTPRTRIVSVMYANNEIGTVQPIKKIAAAIRDWRRRKRTPYPYLHVDACQAAAWLPMDVQALGADLLTFNGTKVYGPHGTAVLYVRRGVSLKPLVMGGSQEANRRAGTEDVAGATGLAAAVAGIRTADALKVSRLRDRLIGGIIRVLPDVRVNGPHGRDRLANNIHISIPDCDSERLLLELDRYGIRAGSGAACTAHRVEPSHVLIAIGTPRRYLGGALRFSLGRTTTRADIDRVITVMPKVVGRVRMARA